MKYLLLFATFVLMNSCYVYRAYEPGEDEEIPTLQQQIKNEKMYEIAANGQTYKVKAVAWEGDSLVAHVNRKEDQPIKFHKNDISEVNHRVFSRGRSDALTFGIYGAVAAIILVLSQ